MPPGELDVDALLWDVRRRVRVDALPGKPVVVRIELAAARGRETVRYLLLSRREVSLCAENPGFPEEVHVRASLRTLTAWWRGDVSLAKARADGMTIDGRRELVSGFASWFLRYAFAEVAPVRA